MLLEITRQAVSSGLAHATLHKKSQRIFVNAFPFRTSNVMLAAAPKHPTVFHDTTLAFSFGERPEFLWNRSGARQY